jgi:hypothetical protein
LLEAGIVAQPLLQQQQQGSALLVGNWAETFIKKNFKKFNIHN